MSRDPTTLRTEGVASRAGTPSWVLILLGVLLVAILGIGGATLYLVSHLEDETADTKQTLKVARATNALLDLVAARQLKEKNIPAKVEEAVNETKTLLTETQDAITATNQAIAATNKTVNETNALLAQAESAAKKAQQAYANLQSGLEERKRGEQQLSDQLGQEMAKVQARLDAIEKRLP